MGRGHHKSHGTHYKDNHGCLCDFCKGIYYGHHLVCEDDEGNDGAQGAQGAQGEMGIQGAQGATGAQGSPGVGATGGGTGAQGVQGDSGFPGNQGAQGAQGDRSISPGVLFETSFTGVTVASTSRQNVGPQFNLSSGANGSYLFVARVCGISGTGQVVNGESIGSYRVNGGTVVLSNPPGDGWTRWANVATIPGSAGVWGIGDPGYAQWKANLNGASCTWNVSIQVYSSNP